MDVSLGNFEKLERVLVGNFEMKTLDEVIKAYEVCHASVLSCEGCPYDNGERYRDSDCYIADAIEWLKGYRGHIELDKLREKYDAENEPLTWDELQKMEGKPVWLEAKSLSVGASPYWKDWYIIKSFSDDEFMHCNDGFEWAKEMQGRLWQAYRKERE